MNNVSQNFSLKDIEQLVATNPYAQNMIRREFAPSYMEFINVLYDDLDMAISELELQPQLHIGDLEDKLSSKIISQLKMVGYNASLGSTGGGNKDLTVLGKKPSWSWIGEAKIYKCVTNLRDGFLQLSTRYRSVDSTKSCAGILAYTFRPYASELLVNDWKNELSNLNLRGFMTYPCMRRERMAFFSVHDHVASGLPFEVRHMAISLYFDPRDKSGLTAKKYRKDKNAGSAR